LISSFKNVSFAETNFVTNRIGFPLINKKKPIRDT